MKDFGTSFRDLGLVPELNTTVRVIFEDSDNPQPMYVKVIGYNGKISELDSFIVLVSYHGVLLERRLDRIYPIPLSIDNLIQLGWVESHEDEKVNGKTYRNAIDDTIVNYTSIKVIFYPKRGKNGKWVLSLRDIQTMSVSYYRVKWYHDLSRIYEFLKGISNGL